MSKKSEPLMTYKAIEKYHKIATNNSVKCKCGHSMKITNKYKRQICRWCGHWVYKDKKTEFEYKLKEQLRK